MYDLYPVSLSARADYVKFTPEVIEKLSPQRHLESWWRPIIVAHGTLETPEFQRQNREFAAAVKKRGEAYKISYRRRLQPFRDVRDTRQSLRSARPSDAGADEIKDSVSGGATIRAARPSV